MKTRERLLFIALDSLLVLAGMRLGYLAQYRLRIPVFETVRQWKVRSRNGDGEPDEELILGDLDLNVAMM